jgi:hypothetical protein
MRRHITQPLNAKILHRNAGIKTLDDGVGDYLPLLLQQLDQVPLRVYLRSG